MSRSIVLAGAVAALSLGLAACGGSGSGSDSAAQAAKTERATLSFARCMREHGIDVPDPRPGQAGIAIQLRGTGPNDPRLRQAQQACQHFLKGAIRPPSAKQQQQAADAALKWAKCMRNNGVDVPDPQVGKGTIKIGGPGQIDPSDPTFQRADRQCRHLLPGGGPSSQKGPGDSGFSARTPPGGGP